MSILFKEQTCPYCEATVEDHESVWEHEAAEEVTCDSCEKVYIAKPQYIFTGWEIEQQCEKCKDWIDEGYMSCDCEEEGAEEE